MRPATALAVDRLLPDLDANIVCGNSLIGTDFYPTDELINLTPDEAARVNALDWSAAFPDIADKQGFDAVIGNPPWLMAGDHVPESMDYFHRLYTTPAPERRTCTTCSSRSRCDSSRPAAGLA